MDAEQESIYLYSILDIVNSMVNHGMMELSGDAECTTIRFRNPEAAKLFNIYLRDLLSRVDRSALKPRRSYIGALLEVCESPAFSSMSVDGLRKSVHSLKSWMDNVIHVDVYFSNLNTTRNIKITRMEYIKICGDISTHNITRLWQDVTRIKDMLSASGVELDENSMAHSVQDFHVRFYDDIFMYHSSWIAEMLNSIRHDVFYYLKTEFERSYQLLPTDETGLTRYRFDVPSAIKSDFGRHCYWELMNFVRGGLHMPRFVASKYVKMRY